MRFAYKLRVNQSNLQADIPVKKNNASWSLNVTSYKENTSWWKYHELIKILRVANKIARWGKHSKLRKTDSRSKKYGKSIYSTQIVRLLKITL